MKNKIFDVSDSTTNNHCEITASKQHDADHAKNAFTVSGGSPPDSPSQRAASARTHTHARRRGRPVQDFLDLVIEGKPVHFYPIPEPAIADDLHPFDKLQAPDGTIYLLCSCHVEDPARDYACFVCDEHGHETWYAASETAPTVGGAQ